MASQQSIGHREDLSWHTAFLPLALERCARLIWLSGVPRAMAHRQAILRRVARGYLDATRQVVGQDDTWSESQDADPPRSNVAPFAALESAFQELRDAY
ncbi:MAG: hypothetical protein QOF51_2160, partial [Chloroflexota bacterium]|nr:hypothetical protein [Chloroflexota bacterium]